MVTTAQALLTEFDARYAYTESDEISLVLDPGHGLFGRSVEKIVSISAGIASAAFTHAAGRPGPNRPCVRHGRRRRCSRRRLPAA